jgi:transposase
VQLHAQHAEVAEATELAQDFARLVRQRQGSQLDTWMARVAKSTIVALQRFATGLADDYDAVQAGLTLPWSNEPVAYCTSSPASWPVEDPDLPAAAA